MLIDFLFVCKACCFIVNYSKQCQIVYTRYFGYRDSYQMFCFLKIHIMPLILMILINHIGLVYFCYTFDHCIDPLRRKLFSCWALTPDIVLCYIVIVLRMIIYKRVKRCLILIKQDFSLISCEFRLEFPFNIVWVEIILKHLKMFICCRSRLISMREVCV